MIKGEFRHKEFNGSLEQEYAALSDEQEEIKREGQAPL